MPLRPHVPDETTRVRLQQFYRSSHDYAHQQSQHNAAYFQKFADVVTHALPDTTANVLEVGAGSGEALRPLTEQRSSVRVTALDLSLSSLSNVRQRNPRRVAPLLGDALALPVRDKSFDAVVCFEVIEHLPDVAAAVAEMLRVLKRPGHLIFGLPNHASLWTPLEDILLGRTRLAFGVDGRRGALHWWARNLRMSMAKRMCQWQPKTAHFWQLKTAHFGERAVGRSGRSPGDAHRACWAGRRERSDRRPGQHAPRRCGAGGHVATPSRCSSDAVLSQC